MRSPFEILMFSALEILGILGLVRLFTGGIPFAVMVIKRFFFSVKLKRFCKRQGYEHIWCHPWYRSVFYPQSGVDFVMKVRGKSYHVVLLSTHYRHREHCFVSPRELVIYRRIMLRGAAGGRVWAKMHNIELGVTTKTRSINLTQTVPEGEEKLLLFYPVARDVTCIQSTRKVNLGNGDAVLNGFRLLTLSAFWEEFSGAGRYLKKQNPWEMM